MNLSQSIMNVQHRATPEQWQAIKANGHLPTRSTILELLCRIKALEATQHAHADASHVIDPEREKTTQELIQSAVFAMPPWSEFEACAAIDEASKHAKPADSQPQPNHPEIPGGLLVKRVACAIYPDGSGDGFREEAREAIREVAAWLREEKPHMAGSCSYFASSLEQEAAR